MDGTSPCSSENRWMEPWSIWLDGSELAVDEVGSCIPDLKDSDPSDLFCLVESHSLVMEDSVFRSMSSHFF